MSTVKFNTLLVLKIEENILFTLNPICCCILVCCFWVDTWKSVYERLLYLFSCFLLINGFNKS
jgi:hypothetical protein